MRVLDGFFYWALYHNLIKFAWEFSSLYFFAADKQLVFYLEIQTILQEIGSILSKTSF